MIVILVQSEFELCSINMPAKVNTFNEGLKFGQLEEQLRLLTTKVAHEEDLAEKADELARKLDDLQDTFVAKYEKRSVQLKKEREQLQVLDKEMYCLIKDATKRGINVSL